MFAVSEKSAPVRSSQTSSIPPQWNRYRKTKKSVPLFLRALLFFQYTSAILTIGTIGASLVMYGLTFYTQQQWNQKYDQLRKLQSQERNITVTKEALQEQIIKQQGNQNHDFVPVTPDKTIYLEPTPSDNLSDSSQTGSDQDQQLETPTTERPLSY
ncbi:MAG: hypothetical protein ACLFQP_02060 [Halothece sp.]